MINVDSITRAPRRLSRVSARGSRVAAPSHTGALHVTRGRRQEPRYIAASMQAKKLVRVTRHVAGETGEVGDEGCRMVTVMVR